MTETVEQARERRLDEALNLAIDQHIDMRLSKVQLATPISPQAKVKLRGILKAMAKEKHPFRACVTKLMPKFGPGRTEAVCATLKTEIKGKPWDKGGVKASEEEIVIDGDVLVALDAVSEHDLMEIFLEARALDEYGTAEGMTLLSVSGIDELRRWGIDGEVGLKLAEARTP